jgi:ABC-type Fe3+/spermidine/putrescine transport system ATPase subunit
VRPDLAAEGRAPALACRALGVAYGRHPVLRGVDLDVEAGEVVAVLGPSGSGKTTLLSAVAGFIRPAAGEIVLSGRPVADASRSDPPERRDVGMVFQHYALWPHLTALEIVAYPLRRAGRTRAEAIRRATDLLERLAIGPLARRRPAELSGGEQQRVGLARALAREASLFLFDEPTAHLDSQLRVVFQDEVAERRRETGAAALYATHDAAEALAIADRVVLLRDGAIAQRGTPTEIYERPLDVWAARLTGPASVVRVPGDDAPSIVRPEWVVVGDGDVPAEVTAVRFRGPHTDYSLETALGSIVGRRQGPPQLQIGQRTSVTLRRTWRLPGRAAPGREAITTGPSPGPGARPARS